MDDLSLRWFTMDDAALVYHWRYDSTATQYSGDTSVAPWSSHVAWCNNIVRDQKTRRSAYMWIAESYSQPVGYVRLTATSATGVYKISIAVDPEMRGCGVGTSMIKLCNAWCDEHGITPFANIHNNNIASRKAFMSAGYTQVLDDQQIANGKGSSDYGRYIYDST